MDFENLKNYEPLVEIRNVLSQKTRLDDYSIFNNLINFYYAQMASNMRASVVTLDRGEIPINFYGISTGKSGLGKTYSNFIMTSEVVNKFRDKFLNQTLPFIVDVYLERLAKKLTNIKNTDYAIELENVQKQYKALGAFLFSFDSGSIEGVKQLRQKLLMGKIGALSFIVDELGSNLVEPKVMDIIKGFLELFDAGLIGDKLLKSSKDSKRNTMFTGSSPANMLLYGTPDKVFDGSTVEKTFKQLLTTGMARRCFFAHSLPNRSLSKETPEEIFNRAIAINKSGVLKKYSMEYEKLASKNNFRKKLKLPKSGSLILIEYEQYCKAKAKSCNSKDDDIKAELTHSYFKVLKLAGAYAFVDNVDTITDDHLLSAIACGIMSSKHFDKYIVTQPKPHQRLLNYLCSLPKDTKCTLADLKRDLPFFPTGVHSRTELLKLAASFGYTNNISLIHEVEDDIDLYSVKMLEPTNINELIVSYSDKISRDYVDALIPFKELPKMLTQTGVHWVNHHLDDGVRTEENCIPGFNMVVLDIDEYVDLETVQLVFSDFKYIIYTTKRHTKAKHRYRIVIPTSHEVELSSDDFVRFMDNIFEWLPFDVDTQTSQRSRKWLSNNGEVYVHDKGNLLDVHLFIPKNSKAIRVNTINAKLENISALERWFIRQVAEGEPRNNTLLRYALVLVDQGRSPKDIMRKVSAMNDKFEVPKSAKNLATTIATTVAKRVALRDAKKE